MTRPRFAGRLLAALALLTHTSGLHAQEEGDMIIGSPARSSGRLAIAFDFTTPFRMAFSGTVGSLETYSGTDPGFDAVVGVAPFAGLFALRPGTEVLLELVDNDPNRASVKIGDAVLRDPGDQATIGRMGHGGPGTLHVHPEFQLVRRAAEGDYVEASLAFRLRSADGRYAPSPVYQVFLSNGFLRPVAHGATYTPAALRCRQVVAQAVWRFVATQASLLAACPVSTQGCTPMPAACVDADGQAVDIEGLLGDIRNARDRALAALLRACGADGADLYDERELRALLGLAACRVESVLGQLHAAPPACRPTTTRHLARLMQTIGQALGRCLVRAETARARAESGLPVSQRMVETVCADARGSSPDAATPLGRIAARRGRARREANACSGTPSSQAIVRAAACAASEVVSAIHPGAKDDLASFPVRRSQGGRPLAEHFPCLRGGAAHVHDHDHAH